MEGKYQDSNNEEYSFRPNKKLFVLYILSALFLSMFIIGIPILFAVIIWYKYSYISLDKNGIHMHKGWLNVVDKQVPYEKVNTVELQRSLTDRIIGSGQLKIFTGNDVQGIVFQGLDTPTELKEMIERRISEAASKRGQSISQGKQLSPADELAKYADLKDRGVITQSEFDEKKRQLL